MWRRFGVLIEEWIQFLRELRHLIPMLRSLLWALAVRPGGIGEIVQVREEMVGMAKLFTYRLGLLPVKPGVDKQRLQVTVGGVPQEPQLLGSDATEATFKAGPENAEVVLTLDYLDAAGNDSDNVETSFTVIDQTAPATPDGLGELTQIAEEDDGT